MSTGTFLIQSAFKRIGVFSIAHPPDPSTEIDGMHILNSMLEMWKTLGIDIGVVPIDQPADEVGEPPDCTNAICDNLAIQCASLFDNGETIVSTDLKNNARRGMGLVQDMYQTFDIPDKVVSSTLPRGQGNTRGSNAQPFFGKDGTVNG